MYVCMYVCNRLQWVLVSIMLCSAMVSSCRALCLCLSGHYIALCRIV